MARRGTMAKRIALIGRGRRGAAVAALAAWLGAATVAAALIAAPARAALDPRDIHPTDLSLGQWLTLRPDDRIMFILGFAAGWHGVKPDVTPETLEAVDEAPCRLKALNDEIIRLANVPSNRHLRVATVLSRAQILRRLPFFAVTGGQWLQLAMRHRLIMLNGIQSGAYGRAVWQKIGMSRDSIALDDALAKANRLVRPDLYADPVRSLSWVIAYYKDETKRAVPLIEAVGAYAARLSQ